VLLHDPITVQRAPLISGGYGNSSRNWAAATSTDYLVHWSAQSGTEVVGDVARTVTRGKIFGGPDLDIEATDRVVFAGETYECDGDVMRSYRLGQLHHTRVFVKRIATELA
jgi:hypothetical protein